jgi:glycosyltransferase involved in cell wall biosynthesis
LIEDAKKLLDVKRVQMDKLIAELQKEKSSIQKINEEQKRAQKKADEAERYYKDLQKFIENKNLQNNVRFFENQTRQQVASLLQTADCFLLPSLIEGWSNAVMEAMYHEKPLILTEVGNARDVIEGSDIGVIVRNPWGDIKSLTPQLHYQYCHGEIIPDNFYLKNAMVYIYNNREYYKKQAKLGRKKIEEKYLVQHMVAEYEREFRNAKNI